MNMNTMILKKTKNIIQIMELTKKIFILKREKV